MKCYNIDVYGEQVSQDSITVRFQDQTFNFIFEPSLKIGQEFVLGLFASKAVLSNEVFRYPRDRRIAMLTESPIDYSYQHIAQIVRKFPIVFTHQQHLLDLGKPFKPLIFGTNWLGIRNEIDSEQILAEHPPKSKLISFMGSLAHPDDGAYKFRREIADLCLTANNVECFGKSINPVPGKREAIAPYYFSIAMENVASNYYFSEKLVDCLLLETVPIYYGFPDISELFNPKGILTFKTKEELISILDNLSPNLYDEMYPFLIENKLKAVQENWHNHQGLLSRLSSQIPLNLLNSSQRYFDRELSLQDKIIRKSRKWWENIQINLN